MRTDVLQVFATCLHAGPFLSGATDRAPEMFGLHSTYRPINAISFVREGAPTRDGVMADRVAPWLRRLKTEDVAAMRPLLSPCAFLQNPSPSTQWGILTDGDRGIELWQPTWKARVVGRFDEKPFALTFTARRFSRWSVLNPKPVADTWEALGQALSAVHDTLEKSIDRNVKLGARSCYEAHMDRRTAVSGMDDLLPAGLDPSIGALAASATRSFVFMESQPWGEFFAEKAGLKEAMERLWRETMNAFESSATAASMVVRQAA